MTKGQGNTKTRRRELRLGPQLDDKLAELAAWHGCTVSDLLRQAAIEHFSLSPDDSETIETIGTENITQVVKNEAPA